MTGIRRDPNDPGTDEQPLQITAALVADRPIARLGTPEEVAAAVLWLCSDQASFITGHAMVIDGGSLAK
jgi:NAD(P)-dependent dehydrogenase (short-subunit alcohol dehydrogenase family)